MELQFHEMIAREWARPEHVTHPPLRRKLVGDFRVGEAWVEVWGFTSRLYNSPGSARQREYSRRRERKLQIYSSYGRRERLVEVYKDDFGSPGSLRQRIEEVRRLKGNRRQQILT
jgi:hypothetical protein